MEGHTKVLLSLCCKNGWPGSSFGGSFKGTMIACNLICGNITHLHVIFISYIGAYGWPDIPL